MPHPNLVGRVPAGDDERVEVFYAGGPGGDIGDDDGVAALAAKLGAGARADDRHGGTGRGERVTRPAQLAIFEAVLDENRDPLARQRALSHGRDSTSMS